jgi:hypothetical protein
MQLRARQRSSTQTQAIPQTFKGCGAIGWLSTSPQHKIQAIHHQFLQGGFALGWRSSSGRSIVVFIEQ